MNWRFKGPLAYYSVLLCSVLLCFSIDMPTFKISNSKKQFFYQEHLNEALSDVMEHYNGLRKFSKYNNID